MFKAIQAGDKRKAKFLQKLILKSTAAIMLAIRQVTQLNAGKKTAGIDGKASLTCEERLTLSEELRTKSNNWKHQKLRSIPIPKKNGSTRILKIPTIADRAWQCLVKYALEPAHEATFHARSYGFRTGRSAHDAQKILFNNLNSSCNGISKRVIELDIEKCFDRISHSSIMERLIAPTGIKIGKFRCTPSVDNYKAFRQKVKTIVNCSNYGATEKAKKLAPVVRGWRNYHRYCRMDGSRFSLWHINHRAFKVFNKEAKQTRHSAEKLIKEAFPAIPYSENKYINVKGEKSPFDGDVTYWSERNSKLYDGETSFALKRQNHKCGKCGLKMFSDEKVHLHHVDGNHENWKKNNLLAVHESCHDYLHMSKSAKLRTSGAGCGETRTPRSNREVREIILPIDSTSHRLSL
ncbi:MAG: group II intron reverse transcriptase [Microcoleus sp.]